MNPTILLFLIIGINVLFSWKGFDDNSFFRKFQFHIGQIRAGEHYRMITSGFLHADLFHLVFNMYALYSFVFNTDLISNFGYLGFVILYFGSLFFGSLFTLYFHKNDFNYCAVGASGAVMGIIYSSILLNPNLTLGLFFIIPVPAYIFGIGYLLYSIYGMKKQNDNIGHTAHFGGAVGGLFFTIIKFPQVITENYLMILLLIIPIIILFIMTKQGKL